MPVLDWLGKGAVVRHDAEVSIRLLHDVRELAAGDTDGSMPIVRMGRKGKLGRVTSRGQAACCTTRPEVESAVRTDLLSGTDFRSIYINTPATLSPVSTGDAHNWRVFIV